MLEDIRKCEIEGSEIESRYYIKAGDESSHTNHPISLSGLAEGLDGSLSNKIKDLVTLKEANTCMEETVPKKEGIRLNVCLLIINYLSFQY